MDCAAVAVPLNCACLLVYLIVPLCLPCCDQEAERRLKSVPLAAYRQAPTHLFDVNSAADWPGWEL